MPVPTLHVSGIGKQQYAKLSYRETLPPLHVRPQHTITHTVKKIYWTLSAKLPTPLFRPPNLLKREIIVPSFEHPMKKISNPKDRGRHDLKSRRQIEKGPIFQLLLNLCSPAFEDPRRCCINELICFRDVLSCWNSRNLLDSKQTGHFWV